MVDSMRYISTRDESRTEILFSDILLGGLAPDGGLYLPAEYPQVTGDMLDRWRKLLNTQGYPALAAEVLQLFIDDISADDLTDIAYRAYTFPKFAHAEIVPVTKLEDGMYIGHLSEGPTAAFKDIAMQLLGEFFEYELRRRGETLTIVGATSGDTGSAAEYAMSGRDGIKVFMLTPAGRMTPFQQAQMFGLNDPNIFNIALEGVFDDCQDVVKAVSADADFKRAHRIGAVNSINWARLVAQVVYYISCYLHVATSNEQKVSFSVPTGNFGDICAGHIAKQMGVPIDKLIVATNENDVLDEFFRTGRYRVRSARETHATSSPSMDISKASNFERFVFDLLDGDAERLKALWQQLGQTGEFDLSGTDAFARAAEWGFVSGSSSHADRLQTIRKWHDDRGVLVDTHTADGLKVAQQYREPGIPMICLETALPAKFAESIVEATGQQPPVPEALADLEHRVQRYVRMPADAALLKAYVAART